MDIGSYIAMHYADIFAAPYPTRAGTKPASDLLPAIPWGQNKPPA